MKTLAIIRPKKQLKESSKVVEFFGYNALATTMIDIVPVSDPLWPIFLEALITGKVDYVIITSANGARRCSQLGLNPTNIPVSTRVVAIGPSTKTALLEEHLRVDLIPSEYSSHGIVQMLTNVKSKNIWVLRSAFGSLELIQGLKNSGANVNELVLYTLEKRCGSPQREFIREVTVGDVTGLLFTSAMTVNAFFDCAARMGIKEQLVERLANILIGAIGAPTAEALSASNVRIDVTPNKATFRELVQAVHLASKTE